MIFHCRFGFTKKGERLTFQQKADECGLKPWNVQTFENGKEISNVVVSNLLFFLIQSLFR